MVNIGIIGIGRWGKNLLRNFDSVANVDWVCHTGTTENREWLTDNYPEVSVTTNPSELLSQGEIDAVAIATPIDTHATLAHQAFKAGLDTFIEKPLATDHEQTAALQRLASEKGCRLLVGYIFVYHPLMQPIFELANEESISQVQFSWEKFGAFREDLLLDLVCHPVSILHQVFGTQPVINQARFGPSFSNAETSFEGTLEYEGATVDISVSRFSPHDTKLMTVASSQGTVLCWTDTELYEFDQHVNMLREIRTLSSEPLAEECRRFVHAVENDAHIPSDGTFASEISYTLDRLRGTLK